MAFLIGNTFSFSLMRHSAEIQVSTIEELKKHLAAEPWESFWGHANTLPIANALVGLDLAPRNDRPAIQLNEEGLPMLYGKVYQECWVLSPDYRPGFRPAIGAEVRPEDILGWQVVRILWKDTILPKGD